MEEYEIKHKSRKSNDKGIKNRGKRGNAYCRKGCTNKGYNEEANAVETNSPGL